MSIVHSAVGIVFFLVVLCAFLGLTAVAFLVAAFWVSVRRLAAVTFAAFHDRGRSA